MRRASDETCYKCGKPATYFWPINNKQIPPRPHCQLCLAKNRHEMITQVTRAIMKDEIQI